MNASNDQNQPTEKTVEQINEHSSSNLVNLDHPWKFYITTNQKCIHYCCLDRYVFEILISLMCMKQMTYFPEVVG